MGPIRIAAWDDRRCHYYLDPAGEESFFAEHGREYAPKLELKQGEVLSNGASAPAAGPFPQVPI